MSYSLDNLKEGLYTGFRLLRGLFTGIRGVSFIAHMEHQWHT